MNQNKYLIIDDDVTFGNTLLNSFKSRELEAYYTTNLSDGIDCINHKQIDRVILDLKLDTENGLDLLDKLDNHKKIKILILTGYGSVQTVKFALTKGACNYLQKPTSFDNIIKSFDYITIEKNPELPTLESVENDYINRVLVEQKGNISQSARILGLHRRSLQRKLKK